MFLQQALNPAPTDPMQAKLIKAMPLLFLFMFHSFPAGLIIYWSFSNIITFLQQLYFTRRLQEKKI
jgi:YidC/Oxa1 family membrane protein insertase